MVTATVDGTKGDGMVLNMHVSGSGNCFKESGIELMGDVVIDQGCGWKRIWTAEGCGGREENGVYFSC